MNAKQYWLVGLLTISMPAYCAVNAAYFQVIQMHAQTEACAQKFPAIDLSTAWEAWRGRNATAEKEALSDAHFAPRKSEMTKNLVPSKRLTEQSCIELKRYLLSPESDAK